MSAVTEPSRSPDRGVVAVVSPVYGNSATLTGLAQGVGASLEGWDWRLRLVVDASPDDSVTVARRLAEADARINVTALAHNVGQHRALARGLAEEPDALVWVCLDADLQDPPEALPVLLERWATGDVDAVFAGRRGHYESPARLAFGRLHRAVLRRLTGLPADAGAYLVMGPRARAAVIAHDAPSIVAVLGVARFPVVSVPVARGRRPVGRSTWTGRRRLGQSVRTLAWVLRTRAAGGFPQVPALHHDVGQSAVEAT